jgi:TRAP-type C4-dicarboxylate transport system permease small subunit
MIHFIHRIRKLFVTTAVIANMIGTCVLFVLVAIMNSDVVARGIFHSPIRGVVEMVVFSLVLIVFLQLPDVVNSGRLTRSDGLLSILNARVPKIASLLSRIIDAVAGIFMAMIAYTIWPEFVESIETCQFFETSPAVSASLLENLSSALSRCDYFGTPGIFTAPWWPARLVIFLGVSLSAIVFMFNVLPKAPDAD